jgi:cysteine synthase A
MIHDSIASCIGRTPLVCLRRLFPQPGLDVLAKLEFLNPGGSVKDRVARFIIEQGLQDSSIPPKAHLIESSSGNLGIALAMVAKTYGLAFTCVIDPKTLPTNIEILRLLGANVEMVRELDQCGSYLHTRIRRVKELLESIPRSVWINQYANPLNWQAHSRWCEQEILPVLDEPIDCLVCAVSTTGTIMGLARCLRGHFPHLRVVAVDAAGSVIFGGPPLPRKLPGIGSSRVPELLNTEEIDEVVYICDCEAVQGCRDLISSEGIFAGGSAGSVVAAIQKLLPTFPRRYRVLTLLPDRGERYLTTVYNDEWSAQLPL